MSGDISAKILLFSYGTLQQAEVQMATFGRLLQGASDALPGFKSAIIDVTHPRVVSASGSAHHPIASESDNLADYVEGTVFLITEAELLASDTYELSDYKRVAVRLKSGREAWVYVQA